VDFGVPFAYKGAMPAWAIQYMENKMVKKTLKKAKKLEKTKSLAQKRRW
jgi:hypothetical protein